MSQTGDSEESNLAAGVASSDVTAGHSSAEGSRDSRLWRSVVIGEQEHRIDMKSIELYKRVISHGGRLATTNAKIHNFTRTLCFLTLDLLISVDVLILTSPHLTT